MKQNEPANSHDSIELTEIDSESPAILLHPKADRVSVSNTSPYLTERAHPNRPPLPPSHPFWYRFLHPWWFTEHLNWNGFVVIFRNWVATCTIVILMVCSRTAQWMGPSSFLGLVLSIIYPSGQLSITAAFISNVMLMAFITFGWLTANLIPMYISNRYFYHGWNINDFAEEAIRKGLCDSQLTSDELIGCVEDVSAHGAFIMGNASVLYAVGLGIAAFVYFQLKFKRPFYLTGVIIGMISTSACLDISIHTPWFDVSRHDALFKPMGVAVGLNMVVAVLIFPVTSSFRYMDVIQKQFSSLSAVIKFQRDFIAQARPSDNSKWVEYSTLESMTIQIRQCFPTLDRLERSMAVEPSFSRYSTPYFKSARITITRLVSLMSGFTMFYDSLEGERENSPQTEPETSERGYPSVAAFESQFSAKAIRRELDRIQQDQQTVHLDSLVEGLAKTSIPILDTIGELLECVAEWTNSCNHFRTFASFLPWLRKKHMLEQKKQALRLNEVYQKYKIARDRFLLERCSVSETPYTAIYYSYIQEIIHNLNFLADQMIQMDKKQPQPFFTWAFPSFQLHKGLLLPSETSRRRNPDSLPPTHIGHSIGKFLQFIYNDLTRSSYTVPIKGSVFVVLAAFPTFFKSTHYWYYSNRLYWVIIMTHLSVAKLAVDNLYNIINRILHTFYAGSLAMAAWYTSAGGDPRHGNPYGFAVVMGFMYIPLHFYREFHPVGASSPVPTLVLVISFTIMLGISWIDGQEISHFSIGAGWTVAWHRFVAVCCGITIGSICTYVPYPHSGKKAIRKLLASALHETGELFCQLSGFAVKLINTPDLVVDAKNDPISARINAIIMQLLAARRTALIIKYEPGLQGPWPADQYRELITLVGEVVELYLHLYTFFKGFEHPEVWLPRMLDKAGWQKRTLMSNYFAVLYMSASALERGIALPELTPAHLLFDHVLTDGKHDIEGSTLDPDRQVFLSSLAIASMIYDRMDRILVKVKMVVGEQYGANGYYLEHYFDVV